MILRYTLAERLVHWIAGLTYVYQLLTGLAFYSPHLYWLAAVLGGGPTSRYWHPWIGLLFTAVTFLRAMQIVFSGPLSESCSIFPDLLRREKLVIVPVTLLMFAIGIAPQFVFNIFNTTVIQMTRLFA